VAVFASLVPMFAVTPVASAPQPVLGLPAWAACCAAVPVVALGVYFMHAACWQLGLLYRAHHERFGWLYQKFHADDRTDTTAQLRRMRRAGTIGAKGSAGAIPTARVATKAAKNKPGDAMPLA
jgi:hypothetical protein